MERNSGEVGVKETDGVKARVSEGRVDYPQGRLSRVAHSVVNSGGVQ